MAEEHLNSSVKPEPTGSASCNLEESFDVSEETGQPCVEEGNHDFFDKSHGLSISSSENSAQVSPDETNSGAERETLTQCTPEWRTEEKIEETFSSQPTSSGLAGDEGASDEFINGLEGDSLVLPCDILEIKEEVQNEVDIPVNLTHVKDSILPSLSREASCDNLDSLSLRKTIDVCSSISSFSSECNSLQSLSLTDDYGSGSEPPTLCLYDIICDIQEQARIHSPTFTPEPISTNEISVAPKVPNCQTVPRIARAPTRRPEQCLRKPHVRTERPSKEGIVKRLKKKGCDYILKGLQHHLGPRSVSSDTERSITHSFRAPPLDIGPLPRETDVISSRSTNSSSNSHGTLRSSITSHSNSSFATGSMQILGVSPSEVEDNVDIANNVSTNYDDILRNYGCIGPGNYTDIPRIHADLSKNCANIPRNLADVPNNYADISRTQGNFSEILEFHDKDGDRRDLFSRNVPLFLVPSSEDTVSAWVIMKGEGDGLESASLVRHGSGGGKSYYMSGSGMLRESEGCGGGGGGGRGTDGGIDNPDEVDYGESGDAPLLSQFHEDAIQQAGTGAFQRLLLLIVGLGLAADTIELFVVAYVIPSAEVELCMSGTDKGWLAAITFVGMMIGAMIWGSLSDNVGRRRALLSALFVNALFGVMTAFMPTYGIFMTTRLCSGIGIGGGIPIVFAYYCEFVGRAERGRHLSWLLVFWAVGGVFTALMAWAIIPRTGITVVLDEQHHFSSWRVFLVVCSLPSFAAVIGLYFMPESPRFLLEKGRDVEAIMVYKKIFKWNNAQNPGAEYQLSELELPSGTQGPMRHTAPEGVGKNFFSDLSYGLDQFWGLFLQLFLPPYLKMTLTLLVIWFTSAFGFYGLSVWFPEYIKLLKSEAYDQDAVTITNDVYIDQNFTATRQDNVHYVDTIFNGVNFSDVVLNHVLFLNCTIFDSLFSNIRSSRTFFKYTNLYNNKFIDTDFYPYRFQDCDIANTTFRAMVPGCSLDFDYNIHYKEIFQENLIGQLTIIPGTLVTSLLMDRIGRVRIMSTSLILSAVSAFFIWFLDTKIGIIVFEAVFNFIFISGWNALDIASTEAFPTHIRTTAYGFLSAASRIAGVLGSLCFGQFIYSSRAIPMLTTTAVLLLGGLVALKLPETKENLL